jgi:hypothetical protein
MSCPDPQHESFFPSHKINVLKYVCMYVPMYVEPEFFGPDAAYTNLTQYFYANVTAKLQHDTMRNKCTKVCTLVGNCQSYVSRLPDGIFSNQKSQSG